MKALLVYVACLACLAAFVYACAEYPRVVASVYAVSMVVVVVSVLMYRETATTDEGEDELTARRRQALRKTNAHR